jgi:hypothetical protein
MERIAIFIYLVGFNKWLDLRHTFADEFPEIFLGNSENFFSPGAVTISAGLYVGNIMVDHFLTEPDQFFSVPDFSQGKVFYIS